MPPIDDATRARRRSLVAAPGLVRPIAERRRARMTLTLPLRLDDDAAMAVLADWLAERGDVRGELVQLQLAREQAPFDARLAQAEARHLAVHAKALLGPLALHQSVCALRWRRGFVVEAALRSESRDFHWWPRSGEPVNRLERAARALTRLPRAEALHAVTLSQPWSTFVTRHLFEAVRALRAGRLPLRRLDVVVSWPEDERWETAPAMDTVELEHGPLSLTCDARVVAAVERALWG